MVAANEVQVDFAIPEVGERAQHVEVAREDDVAVFEPEVEEVANDDDTAKFVGVYLAKKGNEIVEGLAIRRVHFEVYVGENEGLH